MSGGKTIRVAAPVEGQNITSSGSGGGHEWGENITSSASGGGKHYTSGGGHESGETLHGQRQQWRA